MVSTVASARCPRSRPAAEHDAGADPGADGDAHEVVHPTPGAERVLSEDTQIRVMHDHRREFQRLGQKRLGDMRRPAREIREDEGALLVGERSRDRHHRARHLGRDAGTAS